MTDMQIRYLDLKESKLHNRITEAETERSHRADEYERHRHNVETENETYRHDVVTENVSWAQLEETKTHNRITEDQAERKLQSDIALNAERASLAKSQAKQAEAAAAKSTVERQVTQAKYSTESYVPQYRYDPMSGATTVDTIKVTDPYGNAKKIGAEEARQAEQKSSLNSLGLAGTIIGWFLK